MSEKKKGPIRFVSGQIRLSEGETSSREQLLRAGRFYDRRYGWFDVTPEMLLSMEKNFKAGTYGQEIFIDAAHKPEHGAAGTIRQLASNGTQLQGDIEWTEYGLDAIHKKRMIYLSADYTEDFQDNETAQAHGPLLMGAGLTIRPVIKHQKPIQLSEPDSPADGATLFNPDLVESIQENLTMKLKEASAQLAKQLAELKLPDTVSAQLVEAFETAGKTLGEDDKALETLRGQVFDTGKKLAESSQGREFRLTMDLPNAQDTSQFLTAEQMTRLLDERDHKRDEQKRQLSEKLDTNVRQFETLIDASEGLKKLSEDTLKSLKSARDLITADMTGDQVKKLAEHQIRLGNDMAVQAQLIARGFQAAGPQGSVRITLDESNNVKALQETVDKRLRLAGMPDSRRFANTGGQLQAENKELAERVLAQYDAQHGKRLHDEHKMLAAGDGIVSDVAVPAVFERTVIREALYQLVGLQFVDSGTLPYATSAQIPYSYRDTTAAGRNSTRIYEGQGIPRAGVIQTMDNAYPLPQKLAFEVSDELRYLTSSGILNWEAVTENQRNASRIIGEDLEQLIFNEVLHASDEFGAVAVSAENLDAKTDGTNRVFTLANFPVVRPRAIYDLKGSQIGSTTNPITVTFKGGAINEYDGSGTQPAGDYYVLNYNLGEIYIVNQAGAIQTPAAPDTLSVDYSYATNAYAFDTDLGTDKTDEHWDKFLYRYGLRKSVIEDQRYRMVNFGLMSGTVMTQIEQAKQFGANSKRPGTDLQADGNLGRIKDVPNFKTSAPGLWMGDQRVLIGERGMTRLRMMKPWTMGELENQKDGNGRFTGKKEAYGDQFLVLHTPIPLKDAMTSMVLYSAAGRVDRVNV